VGEGVGEGLGAGTEEVSETGIALGTIGCFLHAFKMNIVKKSSIKNKENVLFIIIVVLINFKCKCNNCKIK
jgi:hypothetical protein